MRILIAGGGIGGLSAAIGLGRLGHEVLVLEQASEPKPVGAGISLQPNAMQALATIRLDSEISKRGCAASGGVLMHTNGGIIRRFDFSGHMQRHGFLPHTIHRAALFDVLATAAAGAQVDLRYGQVVKSFVESDGKVVVRTTAGDSIPADALIGADGINSKIREQLWGKENRRYSGYVCWRGVVSTAKKAGSLDTMTEIWGKGARLIV